MNPQNERSEPTEAVGFDRRTVVQTLGAGAFLATFGTGSVLASDGQRRTDCDDQNQDQDRDRAGDDEDGAQTNRSGEGMHPVFGFSALDDEVEPPAAPAHMVEARITPRDDREIPEFFFEPTGLALEPGETVQFLLVSPHHSVTAFHPALGIQQRVPDGVPPVSSPVLPVGASWFYTFDTPGVYDMHCGPHELFGHVVRLVVGEATGPGAEPIPGSGGGHGNGNGNGNAKGDDTTDGDANGSDESAEGDDEPEREGENADGAPEPRPPVGAAVTVLSDPALEPDRILEQGQVSWDEIDDANKEIEL
ncbi:plastocyanin [Natrialbaceae archaeon A-CW3]